MVQGAKMFFSAPPDLSRHTDLQGWAELITGRGRGGGPIFSTA